MRLIPHKNKKNQVKEKLKSATREILAEKGYASISTRDIVKRANTALGQLTYYYKTKDALIIEVIDEIIENIISEFKLIIENSNDKEEALKRCLNDFLNKDDNEVRIFIDLISQSLYNNILSIKSSCMIDRMSEIISNALVTKNNIGLKEAELQAQNYINYFLGSVIRKNMLIGNNYENIVSNDSKSKEMKVKPVYN